MDDKSEDKKVDKDDKSEDYEKRYEDSQAHIAKIEQENATMREVATKDKELLETVSPYIDWDAVNGTKTESDDGGYVDKKMLNDKLGKIQKQIVESQQLQYFRSKYSDLIEHEAIVSAFFAKTDSRKKFEERLEQAVENTKNLLESQRTKGREEFEKEAEETKEKEAKAAGFSDGKVPKGEEKEPDGETNEDYIKSRKALNLKAQGVTAQE